MEFNVGAVVGQTRLIVAGCNGGTLHCKVNNLSFSTAEVSLSFSSLGLNRSYNSLPLSKQASGCRRYRRTSGRRRWTSLEPSITTERSAVLFALKNTAAESFSGAAEEEAVEEELNSDQDIEVTEVLLRGEDTEVREISNSLYSFKTLKKLVFKLGEGGKKFVVDSVSGVLRMGKKSSDDEHPELLALGTSMYENTDGVTALHQWTATEMTMQHAQLVRIERDINYLVFAFSFFGWVRICEAVVHAFSAHPPKLKRLMQASNAMDPLTVAWLAYNLRKPIAGLVLADPTDLQKLAQLKGKLWEELHAFFERQWKVFVVLLTESKLLHVGFYGACEDGNNSNGKVSKLDCQQNTSIPMDNWQSEAGMGHADGPSNLLNTCHRLSPIFKTKGTCCEAPPSLKNWDKGSYFCSAMERRPEQPLPYVSACNSYHIPN